MKKKKISLKLLVIALIILFILFAFFKLNNRTRVFSKNEAIEKVKILSEVKDYLKKVPHAQISVNGEEDDSYLIQVYEIKDRHTATFNWYKVNKTTGEVKKEF